MESINKAMIDVDYVFHAAAMKQIPDCEQNPIEALKTNVLGSNNVLEAAIQNKVKKIICISTDKVINPTSVMGITKLYMEKIALLKAKEQTTTEICIARFCNLIYSNGSVVPLFISQIQDGKPLTITDPEMLRYFISTKQAIELIDQVFVHGLNGEIYIKDAKICSIKKLASALVGLMQKDYYPIKIIGARPGEKKEEGLYTEEEKSRIKAENGYLIISNQLTNPVQLDTKFLSTKELENMIKESVKYELSVEETNNEAFGNNS